MSPLIYEIYTSKDLTLFGCTFHPRSVFADLVGYIEAGGIITHRC